MIRRSDRCPGPRINRLKPHDPHQTPDPLAVHCFSAAPEIRRHSVSPVERSPGVLLINQTHQPEILFRFRHGSIIQCRPTDPDKFTLSADTYAPVCRINQKTPFLRRSGQLFFSAIQAPS
jgi:hypothetical protein